MKESSIEPTIVKIIINGSSRSGVSSLSQRFANNQFSQQFKQTIGVEFRVKYMQSLGVKLQIWEMAGGERFRAMMRTYFRVADGFIIVYSITDRRSFEEVDRWMKQIEELSQHSLVPNMLVGTHLDQSNQRQIQISQGQEMAAKYGCRFFEASSRDGSNVTEVFEALTLEIEKWSNHFQNLKSRTKENVIKQQTSSHLPRSCC